MIRRVVINASLLGVIFATAGWCQESILDVPPPVMDSVDDPNVDVLTRGPVHEAFAEQVSPNPESGVTATAPPPEPIDEIPPEMKPEGEDVVWIPGYWFWDDERLDYIWVSGVWRRVPPGRRWVPGYWQQSTEGYQWVGGFWSAAAVSEVEYLEEPPESLEAGPSSPAPSDTDFWMPGHWYWMDGGYRWQAGSWCGYREGWTWVPARYVWTPYGCVFVPGYWDFALTRRGHLFAPVYYRTPIYLRAGYHYRPVCWIGYEPLLLHLFVRPRCHHLYFGDYYASHYRGLHFTSFHSYHARHPGFASLYVYYDHHFRRRGVDYCGRVRDWHHYYARHAEYRPPHTYRLQTAHGPRGHGSTLAQLYPRGGVERLGSQRLETVTPSLSRLQQRHAVELRDLSTQRRRHESVRVAQGLPSGVRTSPGGGPPSRWRLPESLTSGLAARDVARSVGEIPTDILRVNRGDRHTPVVRGQDTSGARVERRGRQDSSPLDGVKSMMGHAAEHDNAAGRGEAHTHGTDRDRARSVSELESTIRRQLRSSTGEADAASRGESAPGARLRLPLASDAAASRAATATVRRPPGSDGSPPSRARQLDASQAAAALHSAVESPGSNSARRSSEAGAASALPETLGRRLRLPDAVRTAPPQARTSAEGLPRVSTPQGPGMPSARPRELPSMPRRLPSVRGTAPSNAAQGAGPSRSPAVSLRSAPLRRGPSPAADVASPATSPGQSLSASLARSRTLDRAAVASTRRSSIGTWNSSPVGGKSISIPGSSSRSALSSRSIGSSNNSSGGRAAKGGGGRRTGSKGP